MFEEGQERLEKEFDIARILVKLRNLNTFMKNKILDERTQVEIKNSYKNVIAIDTEEDPSPHEDANDSFKSEDDV